MMSLINAVKTPQPQSKSAELDALKAAEDLKIDVASVQTSMSTSNSSTAVSKSEHFSDSSYSETKSSFTSVRTMTMSFSRSTRKLHISAEGVLSAECLLADGEHWKVSTFDLHKHLGNINGELKWGYKDFHLSSEGFRIEGTKLFAKCKLTDGRTFKECWFDLANKLRCDNGVIVVIEYNESLSTMLSEVPWMKFKVVAEPDFSLIAAHPVMQATMHKIAHMAVEHVTAQMSSIMSLAIAGSVEVVTKSAYEHISQSMEVMLQGISGNGHVHSSSNAASKLQIIRENVKSITDVKDALPPSGVAVLPPAPPPVAEPTPTQTATPPQPPVTQPTLKQGSIVQYLNTAIPAPGYDIALQGEIAPGYNPTLDIDKIIKFAKGSEKNEAALITVLVHLGPLPMAVLSAAFKARMGQSLVVLLKSEITSWIGTSHLEEILHALVLGPLWFDVELVQSAMRIAKTDDPILTEILVNRTPSDRKLLLMAYKMRHGKDLQADMKLGEKTNKMFKMILSANPPPENAPVDPHQVDNDVTALYKAGQGKAGVDELVFFEIIINRSRAHIAALYNAYGKKYKSLTKVIKSEFPAGHMQHAMLFILNGAKSKHGMEAGVWRDAKMLEASMKGAGTNDTQLVRRIVRYHWDAPRFEAIKKAYSTKYSTKKYPTTLEERVRGETSLNYGAALLAIIKGI